MAASGTCSGPARASFRLAVRERLGGRHAELCFRHGVQLLRFRRLELVVHEQAQHLVMLGLPLGRLNLVTQQVALGVFDPFITDEQQTDVVLLWEIAQGKGQTLLPEGQHLFSVVPTTGETLPAGRWPQGVAAGCLSANRRSSWRR
jgi:hypothetical protein